MADLSVMYQPIAGGWVKLGTQTGGGRGVLPESIQLEGDRGEGGCLAASFKLKQDPRWIANELSHFTPIAIWGGAEPVWSGRVAMTPTTFGEADVEVVIQCQGWWQHTKDDGTFREWVVSDLSRFTNAAAHLSSTLSWYQAISPDIGSGAIMLPSPQAATVVGSRGVAVTLDMGASNKVKKAVVGIRQTGNPASASWILYARISDSPDAILGTPIVDATQTNPAANTLYTLAPSHATGGRYLHVFWFWGGATVTPSIDLSSRIESCIVFTDTADESGNASILTAPTAISETLDECCPLISPDRSRIDPDDTITLTLPQFPGSAGFRYAHELIKQANSYHGYIARLTPDPRPIFEFHPVPTDYRFVVGEGQYTLLEPAAQDGQGVASRIISEYEDASGVRGYAESETSEEIALAPIQMTNPSFDTNTTDWSVVNGTITRDTGVFHTSPASARLRSDGSGLVFFGSSVVTTPGKRYRLKFRFRRLAALTISGATLAYTANLGGSQYLETAMASQALGSFVEYSYDFVGDPNGVTSILLAIYGAATTDLGYYDSFEVYEIGRNVIDRRGFTRTFLRPMTHRTTEATAEAVADLELDNAQYPPFKGTIEVVGRIPLKGGGFMDAAHIPGRGIGENIVIQNLHDPNTQALGRKGNITSAIYDHNKRRTLIGIDRDMRWITELRSRLELAQR